MPELTTFEIVENEIKKPGGKPVVLEALWDTLDLDGWNLSMYLYTVSEPFLNKKETRHDLGHVTILDKNKNEARSDFKAYSLKTVCYLQ